MMGLKEHLRGYGLLYLMLIALCCVILNLYWDYSEDSKIDASCEENKYILRDYFVRNYTDSEIEQMTLESNRRFEIVKRWYNMINSEDCNIEYETVYDGGGYYYKCMKCENDTIWRDMRTGDVCGVLQ